MRIGWSVVGRSRELDLSMWKKPVPQKEFILTKKDLGDSQEERVIFSEQEFDLLVSAIYETINNPVTDLTEDRIMYLIPSEERGAIFVGWTPYGPDGLSLLIDQGETHRLMIGIKRVLMFNEWFEKLYEMK